MLLEKSFSDVADFAKPENFSAFQKHIDVAWVEAALQATGTATFRRRRLPAEQVIWLVLAIGLFRDRSIWDVVSKLDLALPGVNLTTAPSAITQARARLGEEPISWLFERCASEWAHSSANNHRWRGLALYGIDGTTLKTPDSIQNREHFGAHKTGKIGTSYPKVRMAALMALRSHLLAGASFGPYNKSEHEFARDLWDKVPENSLCIIDRNFLSADLLYSFSISGHNRQWLIRAKSNTKWKVVRNLGPGDDIVEMNVTTTARKKNPTLPKTWTARAVVYERKGFRPQTLLTSLLDPIQYPANELSGIYHERWELELGYGEIKTDMLKNKECIRSQLPGGVRQEIWGILLSYNLIRLEIERIANEAGVEPSRISFVMAMRYIQDEWMWSAIASPGAIPGHLKRLREKVKTFILPKRRPDRSYPRAVKSIYSPYPKKKPKPQATEILN
jgi:hypothetical protein